MAEKTIAIKVELKGTSEQQKKLAKLETEVKKLTNRRRDLNKALKEGTISLDQYGREISQVNTKLKASRREMLTTREAILGLDSFTKKIGKSFARLGKTISASFVGLFALQELFNIARSGAELVSELDELTASVERLGDVSEETAREVAASVTAISSVFGASTEEILTAATAVSEQFGISIEEATEKIKLGFAAGSNVSGEFLSILREYPALLAEVGLSADESFALINQQVTDGVYSDKGVDAIKEAGLRLRELTPATREALDGIGLSSKEIEKALASGSKSVFQVVQDVSRELGKLPPQSAAVGTAIADIFGGPGEDAGLKFLTTLDDINLSFDDVVDGIDDYGSAQLDLVNAQEGFNDLVNEFFGESSTGFTQLKAFAIEATTKYLKVFFDQIVSIKNSFVNLFNESEAFRQSIFGIKSAFQIAFTSIKAPLELLIQGVKTLVETVSFLIDGEFSKAGDAFASGFEEAGKIVVNRAKEIGTIVTENFKEASDARIEVLTDEQKKAKELKDKEIKEARAAEEQKALAAADARKKKDEEDDKARKAQAKADEKLAKQIVKLKNAALVLEIEDKRMAEDKKLEIAEQSAIREVEISAASATKKQEAISAIEEKFRLQREALERKREEEDAAKALKKKEEQDKKEQTLKDKEEQDRLAVRNQQIDFAKETSDLLLEVAGNRVQRQKDLALASLDAQLEQGLITQEEFDKQREDIERKAFQRQKRIDIAQAIANGAVAASKTLAQLGGVGAITPAGAAALGLVAAQTSAQIGIIAGQSFAEGGFTGDGFGSADATGFKQAGVVHEGEYVVPKRVLESQKGGQLVGALESMRLNKPTPLSSIGFANGGFAGGSSSVDLTDLENRISAAVANSISTIQVVNNSTDTISEAVRVQNIQSEASFG